MSSFAPVLVSVYDRPEHLARCLTALAAAEGAKKTTLYVCSDKEKDSSKANAVAAVRKVIREASGFREIVPILRESNYGFPASILEAWEYLWRQHDRIIFLEDDVVVAPGFLRYMNDALEKYDQHARVRAVCGWSWACYPEDRASHYFLRAFSAWGVGLWRNKQFDRSRYGQTAAEFRQSWRLLRKANNIMPHVVNFFHSIAVQGRPVNDISMSLECIKNDLYCVFPAKSLIENIGHDGSGLHCTHSAWVESQRMSREPWVELDNISIHELECHREASVRFFGGALPWRSLIRHYGPLDNLRSSYASVKRALKPK